MREGHRLLFCTVCGERALPLAAGVAATTQGVRRAALLGAHYTFLDAMGYPFRGLGSHLYFAYLALMAVFTLLSFIPVVGCLIPLFSILVALLIPGLLFAIIRTTAAGDNELPDWPDFTEISDRLGEVFATLLVMATALLPAAALLWYSDCSIAAFRNLSGKGPACLGLLTFGLLIGFVLAVPAFGATGTYSSAWLSFRVDLHVRALIAGGEDSVQVVLFLFILTVLSQGTELLFQATVPLLGSLLAKALDTYTSFVGAHMIGLLFRRHANAMDSIYE